MLSRVNVYVHSDFRLCLNRIEIDVGVHSVEHLLYEPKLSTWVQTIVAID